jgi:methionyl aminopeptidase
MVFTIEPMLTQGEPDVLQWDDGWTIVTLDGQPSAQFEHTVIVTDRGVDVLTA